MDVTVAVLAGGRGSRIGGDKAMVMLAGRPLISYPLSAARAAGLPAVVVAKRDTKLPDLDVPVLLEPDHPTHPLLGVITALQAFPAVIAVPCDMPFLAPGDLSALAELEVDIATVAPGRPLPALYRGTMLPQLRAAVQAGASIRSTQAQSVLVPATTAAMHPATITVVNTPEDLAAAEALISRR